MDKVLVIDKRLKKFINVQDWQNEVYSVYMIDIDETFWFEYSYDNNPTHVQVQEFLTQQMTERFADKSLRKGYFTYKGVGTTEDMISKYVINEVKYGKIISFEEIIVPIKDLK